MSKEKPTIEDVKSELRGLDPITRKNVTNFVVNKSTKEKYDFIRGYKRAKGLDTREGMDAYKKKRAKGCRGCPDKE